MSTRAVGGFFMLSLKWYSIMFLALLVILPIQGVVYAESFTPVSLMSTVAPAVSNIKWIGENKKFPEPGSVNLVVFWNGVYSSSIKALAFAEKMYQKYSSGGLSVFGINDIDEEISVLFNVVSRKKISFPLGTGLGAVKAAELYEIRGVPAIIIIDKERKVVYASEGWNFEIKTDIETIIEKML